MLSLSIVFFEPSTSFIFQKIQQVPPYRSVLILLLAHGLLSPETGIRFLDQVIHQLGQVTHQCVAYVPPDRVAAQSNRERHMNLTKAFAVSAIAVSLLTTGCKSFKLSGGGSGEKLNIQERAILSTGPGDNFSGTSTTFKVCAEPSPDAMSSMAMEAAAKGGVPSKVSVELAAALQQSAAFVGLRTSSIQLLRDFGYRLCEAYLSGAIDERQYDLLMRRFQKNVVALLAIEQLTGAVKAPPVVLTSRGNAETSQSLFDQQAVREKVSEKIAELEKEKKTKQDEKTAKGTGAPKELDTQIDEKEAEINRRKEDLAAIDKGIANARGILAGGETQATIQAGSSPGQPSGQDISEVAAIVGRIAMAIVESDDVIQLCLLALGSTPDPQDTARVQFAKWCQAELKLDQDRRASVLAILQQRLKDAGDVLTNASSSREDKEKAKKELKDVQNLLGGDGIGAGGGIFKKPQYVIP